MVETIWPRNKNLRPRDSQRSKLYGDEAWAWVNGPFTRVFRSRKDIDDWVAEITRSRWWKNRSSRTVQVWHVNYNNRPSARPWAIKVPSWIWKDRDKRAPWIVLHELCHVLLWKQLVPWHGWEFARLYLEAVRRWLGAESAQKLREAYKLHRVKRRCNGEERTD